MQVAFLGLGVMGFPMAGYLSKNGCTVNIYNRTEAKIHAWLQKYDGIPHNTPAQTVKNAEIIFMCLGNDVDVRSVVYGKQGVLAAIQKNSILVDHTTASATLAQELALACQEKHADFLDAPVSGGQAGAEQGILTIMIGGKKSAFQKIVPLLNFYAKKITRIGPAGHGQYAKMVNQICIAGILQGLSEGIFFGQKIGIDMVKTLQTISQGAAQSWQMLNRGETMLERKFDFGFALDWMVKDLTICLNEAQNNDLPLPLTQDILQYYKKLQNQGKGREDTSALIRLLDHKNS